MVPTPFLVAMMASNALTKRLCMTCFSMKPIDSTSRGRLSLGINLDGHMKVRETREAGSIVCSTISPSDTASSWPWRD